jgi:phosphinothricin acetyltransferase
MPSKEFNTIVIRRAERSDLIRITEILNQAIRSGKANAYTNEFQANQRKSWLEDHSFDPYRVFVADIQRYSAGYLAISPYREGRQAFRHTAEVSYYVDFDYHRMGIASALMAEAFKHCLDTGINTLLAFLYAQNELSIHFLKKQGFEQWGFFPKAAKAKGQLYDQVIYGLKL